MGLEGDAKHQWITFLFNLNSANGAIKYMYQLSKSTKHKPLSDWLKNLTPHNYCTEHVRVFRFGHN